MNRRQLGTAPFDVSAIGLGCMGMSEFYGPTNDDESLEVLHAAADLGIDFFDTSDMYGSGHNEKLLAKFTSGSDLPVRIATKFGIVRQQSGGYARGLNNSKGYMKKACEASLRRLKRDVIDLYYVHRIDPQAPIEETTGALAELVEEGKILSFGYSEISSENLERACAVHPVAAVQSEYSLWTRDAEKSVLPCCEKHNVAFVAYSPLGRGMLTGAYKTPGELHQEDARHNLPRFHPENFSENVNLVSVVADISNRLDLKPAQVALAWLMSQKANIIPIPGTRHIQYLTENAEAASVKLDQQILDELDRAIPPGAARGERYTEEGFKGVQM
ncbi:aldo/keto reductase [uncultured Tateyamaria sp.]|nr:aldo/keto reductase [uncultured Tateyamaria sp.]